MTIKHRWVIGAAAVLPLGMGASPAQAADLPPVPVAASLATQRITDRLTHRLLPQRLLTGATAPQVATTAGAAGAVSELPAVAAAIVKAPVQKRVKILPGVDVVLGHADTLGEALAFAARAQVNYGLSGVKVAQSGVNNFEIIIGPVPGFAVARTIQVANAANFRNVTVENRANSSAAIILTGLPTIDTTAVPGVLPIERL